MSTRKKETRDKCCICEWEGPSDDVKYNAFTKTWHCPVCGSQDVEPSDFDPYSDDDDEEGDDGGPSRLLPVGDGPVFGSNWN